jgi:hypothetical protein
VNRIKITHKNRAKIPPHHIAFPDRHRWQLSRLKPERITLPSSPVGYHWGRFLDFWSYSWRRYKDTHRVWNLVYGVMVGVGTKIPIRLGFGYNVLWLVVVQRYPLAWLWIYGVMVGVGLDIPIAFGFG